MDTKPYYIHKIWFRPGDPCIYSLYKQTVGEGYTEVLEQCPLGRGNTTKWTGSELSLMLMRLETK